MHLKNSATLNVTILDFFIDVIIYFMHLKIALKFAKYWPLFMINS